MLLFYMIAGGLAVGVVYSAVKLWGDAAEVPGKRILIVLLFAAILVGAGYAVLQLLLEDQCDPEFTPAECSGLG